MIGCRLSSICLQKELALVSQPREFFRRDAQIENVNVGAAIPVIEIRLLEAGLRRPEDGGGFAQVFASSNPAAVASAASGSSNILPINLAL